MGPLPVCVVGSVALDTIETQRDRRADLLGGSAVHFALAASNFAPVRLVGVVGDDFPGEHVRLLERRGVDVAGLERKRGGKTFRWSGRYLPGMNARETLRLELNVFADFDPKLPPAWRDTPFLFLANGSHRLQRKVLEAVPGRRLAFLDTMNHWIQNERDALLALLPRVDGIFVNEEEAKMLASEENLVLAGRRIRGMGAKRVVLKKGDHGVLLFEGSGVAALPAYPLEEVADPTGAGDAFAGAFMGHLAARGEASLPDLKRAAAVATVVASFAVERFGVEGLASLDAQRIEERLGRYREMLDVGSGSWSPSPGP